MTTWLIVFTFIASTGLTADGGATMIKSYSYIDCMEHAADMAKKRKLPAGYERIRFECVQHT
jgi:hypothetical protein